MLLGRRLLLLYCTPVYGLMRRPPPPSTEIEAKSIKYRHSVPVNGAFLPLYATRLSFIRTNGSKLKFPMPR